MCCTFGDDTDKEWWRKHKLPSRPIIWQDGKITTIVFWVDGKSTSTIFIDDSGARSSDGTKTEISNLSFLGGKEGFSIFGAAFNSSALSKINCVDFDKTISVFRQISTLKPKQANTKLLELLQAEGKLLKQDNITHTVKCAERSATPIEIIPTYQWFVKVTDKKEALTAKGAECQWFPAFMQIRLNQWIDGLKEDWCISRQRFFGVPFPIWYSKRAGEEGKILTTDMLPADPLVDLPKGYTREEVTGDKDVMDTWATSSISPQINARSLVPNKLFPADLRPQAHEIIRTWAFYTIVKAHLHANTIPWKNLMISGWCLASDKTKMSKSKGNVITPVDLIRDKGADVVRYWASTSRLGADTAFSEDLLKIGKKLATKLWNATSFAAIHLGKLNVKPTTASADEAAGNITETLDKWILTRLQKTIARATQEFERFEYCDARVAVEEFFWKDFCDNYLELVKARAYVEIGDAKSQTSAHLTLYYCLDAILRLLAPFMPHITEELYSHIFDAGHSVHMRGNWPKAADYPRDDEAEASGVACVGILETIRKAKSEKNVSIKFPIKELVLFTGSFSHVIKSVIADLKAAGNVESITVSEKPVAGIETEDKRFTLAITFGQQADVA
jgi:valyl-tRNA synthetase